MLRGSRPNFVNELATPGEHGLSVHVGLYLSPLYGAICGSSALVTFMPREWPMGAIFGAVVGLVCFPGLSIFFAKGGNFIDSLKYVLVPSMIISVIGGLLHPLLSLAIAPAAYILLAYAAGSYALKRRKERDPRMWVNHCPQCGYDLHGLSATNCPECGTAADQR